MNQPSLPGAVRAFWRDQAGRSGPIAATRALAAALWEFARDSAPSRLRQRFGDADYDWDHRVNTTSGAVGWRDRLLGVCHSPYQPTEPALFREMLEALGAQINHAEPGEAFRDFTFLDLGSGKGRTLLMASDYPFRRIVGVELLPALDAIAKENLREYKSESQKCFAMESVCGDATSFPLPEGPLIVYLFNPFPEAGLQRVVANLERAFPTQARSAGPHPVYVLYHNPLLESVLAASSRVRKISGTHQYSVFVCE